MRKINLGLVSLLFIVIIWSLNSGRYHINPLTLANLLVNPSHVSLQDYNVLVNLRLPRILLALAIGSGLSVSGAALQGVLNNPLASPSTLGVVSGAAFGGITGLLFRLPYPQVTLLAFFGGVIANFLTIYITRNSQSRQQINLILAGISISALFSALISLVKFVADPVDQLPSIVFWIMGSLSHANWTQTLGTFTIIGVASLIIWLHRWHLNLLSLNDEHAQTLGAKPQRIRYSILILTSIIVAACVAVSGQILWLGLITPHIARRIVGPNFSDLIPTSVVLGAIILLSVDTLSRTLLASELPPSIITALGGSMIFLTIIKNQHSM